MDPFLGQIQPFGFNFAPRGWAKCDGQLMPISQYSALFSLLGTMYGGDGRTTFALPDLRGRSIVHVGNGPGLTPITQGEKGGVESLHITLQNMPSHSHVLQDGVAHVNVYTTENNNGSADSDGGANGLGTGGTMPEIYRESPTTADHVGGVSISGSTNPNGGSIPMSSRNPFLGINVCIALQGIFPSRS